MALREFLQILQNNNELHRTRVEIDPSLELTEIARRAIREGKPALLIERPKASSVPVVINHYASERRIELALGRHPDRIGEELIAFLERAMPPTLDTFLGNRPLLRRFWHARPKRVSSGVSQEVVESPNLDTLPIQTCWPKDGGKFITYGQVITADPASGRRNIGIYRMQVFDASTTGMHWQIQKGGGFHFHRVEQAGEKFELAVALGTDPALTLASVAPLPEGIDEALFAGFLADRRVEFVRGKTIALEVPASAEFILEGTVPLHERRLEGPFGDHFGHYSPAARFPLFRLSAMTHRRDPIYPAIVVGPPPMEDKFLGDATQSMLGPLVKLIHREVTDLRAYYEAGFHNLLVAAIEQRYQKEAMKAALGMMGTDQLSLTKCMILVSSGVNVRDWPAVLREIRDNFDPHTDFVMIPRVPLDTLDFTSYTMNLGSKMIVDATRKNHHSDLAPTAQESARNRVTDRSFLTSIDRRILDAALVEETLLLVKVDAPVSEGSQGASVAAGVSGSPGRAVVEKLVARHEFSWLRIIAAVSPDVDIHAKESYIWGVFTRFDCARDIVFAEQTLIGISPVYRGVLGIDATWKPGYPEPLTMPEEIVRRVDDQWGKIWK